MEARMNERDEYIGKWITDQEAYHLVERIGEGEFGIVYRAEPDSHQSPVAFKLLRDSRFSPQDRGRFEREAKVLASLRHPNIVRVHRNGHDEGAFYIIMEYIAGDNLRKKHPEGQPVS